MNNNASHVTVSGVAEESKCVSACGQCYLCTTSAVHQADVTHALSPEFSSRCNDWDVACAAAAHTVLVFTDVVDPYSDGAVCWCVAIYAVVYVGSAMWGASDYSYWWDLEIRSSALLGSAESGVLVGGKLGSGIVADDAHAGIALEGGFLNMDVELENSDDIVELEGGYVMAGPAIRWADGRDGNPTYFFMELLGGTTEHEEVDLMSVARMGFNLGLGPVVRFGLNIGAMYLGLELDEGLIRKDDNFTTILGTELGIRF